MSTLTIHNIDEDLEARLRARADDHGRTVDDEARAILERALRGPKLEKGLGTAIHEWFAEVGGVELDLPPRDSPVRIVEFPK